MRDCLVITPTREREANARRLIEKTEWTVTGKTDLILAVDDDDHSYDSLISGIKHDDFGAGRVQVVRGPRQDVAGWTNTIAVERAGDYRWLASLGDDHVPVTRGWDAQLTGALSWRPGVAYGNDLWQGELCPTAAVISAPVVAALGYMCPPGLEHLYIDVFWKRLGEDLGCLKYLPGVIIKHLHPHASEDFWKQHDVDPGTILSRMGRTEWDDTNKAAWDPGYERSNSPAMYSRDELAYEQFLYNRWPDDLARLKEKLGI